MNVKQVFSPECGFYLFNIKLSFREKIFCASFPCVPSLAGDCVVGNCSFGLRPTFPHVQESHYSASHVNTDGIKMMVWDRFRLWTGNQGIGFLKSFLAFGKMVSRVQSVCIGKPSLGKILDIQSLNT